MEDLMKLERRVLIIGALEHLGTYITRTCAQHADFTMILVPELQSANGERNARLKEFEELGVAFIKADIYDTPKLLRAVRAVEVVIWIINLKSHTISRDVIEIVEAMRKEQSITRFIVAGFSYDVDRTQVFPEEQAFISMCRAMKRLIENSGIPFTFIIPNFLAGGVFGRKDGEDPTSLPLKFPFYGDGHTRVVFTDEVDVGTYIIYTADDPRTINKTLYIRSPENVMSLDELLVLWEAKVNKQCPTPCFSEEALSQMYIGAPKKNKVELAIMHSAFIRGDQTNFAIDSSFGEVASDLYPSVVYTTMDVYLNKFLPPGPQ
ncbi:phenylcoumaran benzylic ether reductase Pyrc5-like [Carex rostrata]